MTSEPTSVTPTQQRHKVVIPTDFYVPAFLGGGPIQTLKALIEESPTHFDTQVICANHDLGQSEPLTDRPNEWRQVDRARVRYVQGGLKALLDAFRSASDADLVYLNSLFSPQYSVLPLMLRSFGRWRDAEVLIAPRGELYPGALAQKPRKKQLFLRAFRALGLHNKVMWHASTDDEAQQIRSLFGRRSRVLVRENETSLPKVAHQRTGRGEGPLRAIFASRLHPKKGLHILLEALADVTEPMQLQVVGAFADAEYELRCRAIIRALPDHVSVEFTGSATREVVLQRMHGADLMTFPTTGENFGHVIAEALSESCPVICSDHTPWSETLISGGGGVVSPNTPEAWTTAINDFAAAGPEAWREAAERAGESYRDWRNEPKGQHVFELVQSESVKSVI